jgi:ABC-type multidrug transport system fused ATPase/permease subunit
MARDPLQRGVRSAATPPNGTWGGRRKEELLDPEMELGHALKWLVLCFFSRRRRWQARAVLVLMLVGGFAELFTLAAVYPLLSLMADPEHIHSSRLASIFRMLGVQPTAHSLPLFGILFCFVALGAAGVRILLAWASQKLVFRVGYDLGVRLYERMLWQPYSFHAAMNSSRVISSVNNIQRLLTGMFLPLMQGLSALILASFIVAGLLFIDPSIALSAIIGFGGIYFLVSVTTRGRLRRNAEAISAMRRLRVQALQEGLGGIRDVLIDNTQPLYVKKFSRLDTNLRDAQAANALIAVVPRFVVEALGMVFIVLLALVINAIEGSLAGSLPVLAVLALGAQRLMPLLQQVYAAWANVVGNRTMFLNVIHLLRLPIPARFEGKPKVTPLPLRRMLCVEHVSFRYSPDQEFVLDDIDIAIPKGSWSGFVGKTGSGKSTLVDLIMGLLKPTEGQISVDGMALDEHNVRGWQQQIAHVSQHIFLADATIMENIAFGMPRDRIDEARVRRACRQAELDELIVSLPEGLETFIGERGVRLSGGQRQRIGIARALYKKASVLVLDEATSALDDATELGIMASLRKLGGDYTLLMIAHRLTTLRDCDTIYRLSHGRLVQQGGYDDVIGGPPGGASDRRRAIR